MHPDYDKNGSCLMLIKIKSIIVINNNGLRNFFMNNILLTDRMVFRNSDTTACQGQAPTFAMSPPKTLRTLSLPFMLPMSPAIPHLSISKTSLTVSA